VLWFLVKGIRDGRAWAWGGLAISVGLAVLSPHPQLLQYLLLASGAFALYLTFSARDDGSRLARPIAIRRLAYALGGVLLGGLIGAVQYVPVREYVPYSPRAGGKGYEFASSYSMPLEELLNTIVPQFSGMLNHYWGRNGIHLHSEYIGGIVLMLAVAGLIGGSWSSFRKFWLGIFVVSLLWALGSSTPFYHLVYAIVPGAKYFRAPSTMMYVTMFSVAVFVALGTERVLARQVGKRYAIGWLIAAGVVAVLGTSGALTNVARVVASSFDPSGQRDTMVSSNGPDIVFGALRSALFIALGAGLLWAWTAERLGARAVAWSVAALLSLDLWSIERHYWMFSPRAAQLYATDPAIDAIKAAPQPGRVLALDFLQTAFADPFLHGDGLMVHNIRNATGYHGNQVGRYQSLVDSAPLSPSFWRHENVQYLYTTLPDSLLEQLQKQLQLTAPLTKMLGPVRNAAGTIVYLYRLPGDNPAAWVANGIVRGTDEQAQATVLDPGFNPTRATIVDTSAHVETVDPAKLVAGPAIPVTIGRYDAGAISLKLASPAPAGSALVVAENYFPGWTASVDGKAAAVVRADFNLIGVILPAGANAVDLTFADPAYRSGKMVTFVALAIALLVLIGGVFAQRQSAISA
jgi:hypothetical protein